MPPVFVTCYICGRDFGTRSIGIHVPKCQEKWEAQQEKLPRAERREVPRPPDNFQRILSGEVSGAELMKINQKAAEDYKNEVLEPCTNCGRTFLPEALLRHQNCCKEDKPMSKKKGPSYTSKAKARVNYPKLKTNKNTPGSQKDNNSSEETESQPSLAQAQPQSPSLIRKETITISKPPSPSSDKVETEARATSPSPPAPSSSINRKDTVILSRASPEREEKARTDKTKDVSSVDSGCENSKLPTKEEFIRLIETEPIFESQQHRAAILGLVTGYARDLRRTKILELLDNEAVFEDVNNLEEVIALLTEFVRSKTNNNHQ